MALPYIAAGLGIASAVSGWGSSKKQASNATNLANWNAHYIGQETDEQIRKLELTQEQVMGQARAAVGSSGFSANSNSRVSPKNTNEMYLAELETQFKNEKSWLEKSKVNRQRIARMGGSTEASAIKDSGITNTLSMGSSILGFFK